MACAFPQLDEGRCVSEELLAGRCERRAALVADEQRPAQPLFERTHAGADGCLADVKLLSRAHEALRPDDGEKRSCEFYVHINELAKIMQLSTDYIRLSHVTVRRPSRETNEYNRY